MTAERQVILNDEERRIRKEVADDLDRAGEAWKGFLGDVAAIVRALVHSFWWIRRVLFWLSYAVADQRRLNRARRIRS